MTVSQPARSPRSTGWTILFFALPWLYFGAYGFHGYSDIDHGFVTGLAWRVLQGETVYTDFLYVRPPLTPYLHALVLWMLPDSYGVLGERLLFFLTLWLSVALVVKALSRRGALAELGLSAGLLGCLGFVFTCHNLSPIPWHTVDGVLFASLGLWLFVQGPRWPWTAGGCVALILAAACKQSFYPLPLVGIALCTVLYGRAAGIRAATVTASIVATSLLSARWFASEWFQAGLTQTSMAGRLVDLLDAGAGEYLESLVVLGPFFLLVAALRRWAPDGWSRKLAGPGLWVVVLTLLAINAAQAFEDQRWTKPRLHYSQIPFLLALVAGLWEWRRDQERSAVLLAALAISWCVGISWGAQSPLLCFTPAILGTFWFLKRRWEFQPSPKYSAGLLSATALLFFLLHRFPYADDPRSRCINHLGDVYPRLSGIYAGNWGFAPYEELASLRKEHPGRFAVLPAVPVAHYVTQTKSPLPVDWFLNVEANGTHWRDRLLRQLNEDTQVVFLQKRHLESMNDDGHRYGCWLGKYVLDHWTRIGKSRHYLVYAPPRPAARVPDSPPLAE